MIRNFSTFAEGSPKRAEGQGQGQKKVKKSSKDFRQRSNAVAQHNQGGHNKDKDIVSLPPKPTINKKGFKPESPIKGKKNNRSTQQAESQKSKSKRPTRAKTPVPSTMFEISAAIHPKADSLHPLIMLQTEDHHKYLFGSVPEGTQRIFHNNQIKMGKIKGIFITGILSWSKISGLPGLILSVSDQGLKNLKLSYGSEILQYLVASWRYFVFRKGMDLSCRTINFNENYFKDKYITAKAFHISNQKMSQVEDINGRKPSKNRFAVLEFLNKLVGKMFPLSEPANKPNDSKQEITYEQITDSTDSDPNLDDAYVNTKLPPLESIDRELNYSTNYLVEFYPVRGKFNVAKAKSLGVPPGKLYAQLSKNQAVLLENGTTVQPEQVVDPPREYSKVLIFDIASEQNMENLYLSMNNMLSDQKDVNHFKGVKLIYYLVNEKIDLEKSKCFRDLVELLDTYLDSSKHVISHKDFSPDLLNYSSAAIALFKLKSLQPDNYRLPLFDLEASKSFESVRSFLNGKESNLKEKEIYPFLHNEAFNIKYDFVIDKKIPETVESNKVEAKEKNKTEVKVESEAASEDEKNLLDGLEKQPELIKYWKSLLQAKFDVSTKEINDVVGASENDYKHTNNWVSYLGLNTDREKVLSLLRGHVQTITLGTGSAIPSKYRNVSSTIVRVPYLSKNKQVSHRSIILDAGENTLGSIKRIYDQNELKNFFGNELKLIYLSHLHADHHLGIVSLIEEWCKYQREKGDSDAQLYIAAPWQFKLFLNDLRATEQKYFTFSKVKFISCEDFLATKKLAEVKQKDLFSELHKGNCESLEGELAATCDSNSGDKLGEFSNTKINGSDAAPRDRALVNEIYDKLGLYQITTCRAIHCRWAYCVTFSFKLTESSSGHADQARIYSNDKSQQNNPFKVSYSGDTRPVPFFARIGYGSDILIHEATLDDELQQQALEKSHSTTSEAIGIGQSMRAKKLILTHFSQRYPKLPELKYKASFLGSGRGNEGEGAKEDGDVEMAFDSLMVYYKDIGAKQSKILEELNKIYS